MADIQHIIEYLSENLTDPVPRFVMVKEIYKEPTTCPAYMAAYEKLRQSKWYRVLADEQWEDGSWGSFHSMVANTKINSKFISTEAALRRARELSLPKDDPVVAKAVRLMERYVRGEQEYPDRVEKHNDGGRGFMIAIPFLVAGNLNLFDPDNLLLGSLREVYLKTLKVAFAKGDFDEGARAAW